MICSKLLPIETLTYPRNCFTQLVQISRALNIEWSHIGAKAIGERRPICPMWHANGTRGKESTRLRALFSKA